MHDIGTANFVLGGAPPGLRNWHGKFRAGGQRLGAWGWLWHLASEEGAHEIGTANFVRRVAPGMCEERGAAWECS